MFNLLATFSAIETDTFEEFSTKYMYISMYINTVHISLDLLNAFLYISEMNIS